MGDTGDTGKLRFVLLGPLRAWYGDEEIDLGRPQQRALLAVLLDASGRTVAHGVLAEGIWGEGAAPTDPRKALQLLVYRLRSAFRPHLAESPIVRVGDGYALRAPGAWVDTAEWRRRVAEAHDGASPGAVRDVLRDAQGLWAGEPLAGLPGPHAEAVRARLAEERLTVLEQRLELDAELGDRPDLTAEAAALCLEHPHRPRLVAVHMRALHRAGRTAEALAVYEDARASLPPEALSGPPPTKGSGTAHAPGTPHALGAAHAPGAMHA
ncbi:AfsR/SARP family transcriptional regulator, partial [Streptomyces exfoliatus]|uniref:AfsR/SARP family transcriptional regulator n=1 Tax=Streptomyces exfoliatus TaxID=1905 RepID=UPI000562844D